MGKPSQIFIWPGKRFNDKQNGFGRWHDKHQVEDCEGVEKVNWEGGSFYSAPSNRVQPQLLEQNIWGMKSKFILGGDFNAKHPAFGCITSNPRGIALLQVIQGLQVKCFECSRTYSIFRRILLDFGFKFFSYNSWRWHGLPKYINWVSERVVYLVILNIVNPQLYYHKVS
jgi:hypothetical protein